MSTLKFTMKPADKKRPRGYKKKSIYDPLIDEFLKKGKDLVEVEVESKSSTTVTGALAKRIEARELDIDVSSVGGVIYLEKKKKA